MRHYIVDRIEGLPPKKDGAKSMWDKANIELARLVNLRQATLAAFAGDPPLFKNIAIKLRVYVGPVNSRSIGDLDNFVTGICDGLQSAHPGVRPGGRWCEPDCEAIHPRNAVAILDDVQVISIGAKKVVGDESPWYTLELQGD
jgi:hypothetical protein